MIKMIHIKNFILVIGLQLIISTIIPAQFYNGGGGPNAFYQLPMSPREIGMGSGGISTSTGIFSPPWNPAGIVNTYGLGIIVKGYISGNSKLALNSNSFGSANGDIDFLYAAFALKITDEVFLASTTIYRAVRNIWETEISNMEEVVFKDSFNLFEGMHILTLAFANSENFSAGINIKSTTLNYSNIAESNNIPFAGFDIGFRHNYKNGLNLGGVYGFDRDFTNAGHYAGIGASYNFSKYNVLVGIDAIAGNFMPLKVSFGAEYTLLYSIFIRSGVRIKRNSDPDNAGINIEQLGAGIGFRVENRLQLDLSYSYFISDEGSLHELIDSNLKFSLKYSINTSLD